MAELPAPHDAALDAVLALRGDGPLLHVLDIGANPIEGEVSYQRLLDRGLCRVTGFEPQAEALAALNARKGPNEHYLPDAVGDGGNVTLHVTRSGGFTSIWPRERAAAALMGWTRPMEAVQVLELPTRRLDDLDLGPAVDFLKIDVQGSELAILSHGVATLAQAVAVQTEVRLMPIYDGEPSFGQLDGELRRQGFAFHDFMFLKRVPMRSAHAKRLRRSVARQVVDGDAVYLRALTRPERISEDQLFRLALLALGVLDNPGIAVHALDLLADRGRLTSEQVEAVIDLFPPQILAGRK